MGALPNTEDHMSDIPTSIGVPNPRALAEVILRRRVDWRRVAEPQRLIEHALGVKYEELFDTKFKNSPLYFGLRDGAVHAAPEAPAKVAQAREKIDTLKQVKARTSDDKAAALSRYRAAAFS